jgi:hypothetical protein
MNNTPNNVTLTMKIKTYPFYSFVSIHVSKLNLEKKLLKIEEILCI